MVRVGIRTKGCSGQQYDLQYTTKKEKFDEEVKQDGKKKCEKTGTIARLRGELDSGLKRTHPLSLFYDFD